MHPEISLTPSFIRDSTSTCSIHVINIPFKGALPRWSLPDNLLFGPERRRLNHIALDILRWQDERDKGCVSDVSFRFCIFLGSCDIGLVPILFEENVASWAFYAEDGYKWSLLTKTSQHSHNLCISQDDCLSCHQYLSRHVEEEISPLCWTLHNHNLTSFLEANHRGDG